MTTGRLFGALALLLCGHLASAQELDFTVRINTPKLQLADPRVFESLESAMLNFLNNQQWTSDVFLPDERIRCNVQLNIFEERSETRFSGELAIQAVRPVYGSNYETPIFSHVDKDFIFDYEQFQPLEYSKNVYNANITSVLSFYAYIILGLDYDTFSPYGGEAHYQTALDILNTVPPDAAALYTGWRQQGGSNLSRFWLIENLLNPRVRPMRKALYDYHRLGLDEAHRDVAACRKAIASALEEVDKVNRAYPNMVMMRIFVNAKSDEIVEVYKPAPRDEQSKIVQYMSRIDAANSSKYRDMMK